jgi:hypothetical protein
MIGYLPAEAGVLLGELAEIRHQGVYGILHV